MPRGFLTSRRAFPIALILTAAIGMLPRGAFGVSGVLSEIMRIVLAPFAEGGNIVANWLRPPPVARLRLADSDVEHLKLVEQQMVEYEKLYAAEQLKVEALQRQIEELQKIPAEYLKTPVRPLIARIGVRSPTSSVGMVTLNRGTRDEIKPGTIAVYSGVHLLGRVTDDISAVQCMLRPLANPSTGMIIGAVRPKDRVDVSLAQAQKVDLTPRGDGTLSGNIDKLVLINPGDEVRLVDPTWPAPAQAMIIGTVESVKSSDAQPLRNTIVVRPAYSPAQVATVTLIIELDEPAGGARGAGQ